MKLLVQGIWHTDFQPLEGERIPAGSFRYFITADGSSDFKAEPDRYHLYVSYACPFAHRTILARKLKGLENIISVSILSPDWGDPNGWIFGKWQDTTPDTINGFDSLHQVYTKAKPDFTGRVTVPVLWDKQTGTIVNNESADILRMLGTEFNAFGNMNLDLYPYALRAEIDEINAFVSDRINIGVYKVGFASSQTDYDRAIDPLFDALDVLEARLSNQQYLVGNRLTEADIRLFVTLIRFDVAYYTALNCNLRHLTDYPSLWNYTRHIYHFPGVAETVKFNHIKRHYFDTYEGVINRRIIPKGPIIDFGLAPSPTQTTKAMTIAA